VADSRAVARTTATKGGESHMTNLYAFLQTRLASGVKREEGQTMAEYGVVLAVITVAAIAAFGLLGTNIKSAINSVAGKLLP
jgi:Flp pilus assembly pilin Flp